MFLAEGVNLRDVGVVQLGGRLGLAAEGLEEFGLAAEALLHHFDGDFAV